MNKHVIYIVILSAFMIIMRFFPDKAANAFVKNNDGFEAMVTIEASTGRVLYEKDKDKRLPMASTTKVLTALVALENVDDLNRKYKIPKEAVGVEGSSIYLKEGEELTIKELLYGLMLRSGNDSAVAIAIIVGGSVESFVKMMNDYCKGLNLTNTNIVTVNGLHHDNHYTSANDLAIITAKAMQNDIFKEIVSTKEIKISNTLDLKNNYRFLKNKNKLLNMIDGADGVKTGFTKKAGKCFVGSATRNNMSVISVVLNSDSMFNECARLINKAFEEFKIVKLLNKGELLSLKRNNHNISESIDSVILKEDIFYCLSKKELALIKAKLNIKDEYPTKDEEFHNIGSIDFVIENDLIFSEKIYTIKGKKSITVKENFNKIIKAF